MGVASDVMDVDGVLKECGEVYSRLFDHKPVIRGEIHFFLREFEEKRNNREQARLQKALGDCREVIDNLLPSVMQQLGDNIAGANHKVVEAAAGCQNVLSREGLSEKNTWLAHREEERLSRWSAFVDMMCERCSTVDEEYSSEVKRVEDYYRDLERKLMKEEVPSSSG